jgi:hypothetical protein
LTRFIKEWSGAGAAIAVIIFFFTQWTGYVEFRTETKEFTKSAKEQLKDIDEHLTRIDGELASGQIQRLAADPENPKNAQGVISALAAAKKAGVAVDSSVIQEAGPRFIDVANKSETAWSAALVLMDYRSTGIVLGRVLEPIAIPAGGGHTHYDFNPLVPGKPAPTISHLAVPVLPGTGARYETIGSNMNPNFESAEYYLTGGAVSIDNKDIRNVVFKEVEIHYSGKPLMIQAATFINCTFVFDNTPSTRDLGKALFAESTVNFKTPSA